MADLKYPLIKRSAGTVREHRTSPTGRTLWCGPFMVAMVTGLEYDDAYAKVLADLRRHIKAMRAITYKGRPDGLKWSLKQWPLPTSVKGTHKEDIVRVLNKLGVKAKLTAIRKFADRPTLLTFSREHTVKGKTYIIVAGHHWLTIKDGILYHSHHDPLPVEDAPRYRMARVTHWAMVTPRPAAILADQPEAQCLAA